MTRHWSPPAASICRNEGLRNRAGQGLTPLGRAPGWESSSPRTVSAAGPCVPRASRGRAPAHGSWSGGSQPLARFHPLPSWANRPQTSGPGGCRRHSPCEPGVPLGSSRGLYPFLGKVVSWGRHCSKLLKKTTRFETKYEGWVAGPQDPVLGWTQGHRLVGPDSAWEREGLGVLVRGLPCERRSPSGLHCCGQWPAPASGCQ